MNDDNQIIIYRYKIIGRLRRWCTDSSKITNHILYRLHRSTTERTLGNAQYALIWFVVIMIIVLIYRAWSLNWYGWSVYIWPSEIISAVSTIIKMYNAIYRRRYCLSIRKITPDTFALRQQQYVCLRFRLSSDQQGLQRMPTVPMLHMFPTTTLHHTQIVDATVITRRPDQHLSVGMRPRLFSI